MRIRGRVVELSSEQATRTLFAPFRQWLAAATSEQSHPVADRTELEQRCKLWLRLTRRRPDQANGEATVCSPASGFARAEKAGCTIDCVPAAERSVAYSPAAALTGFPSARINSQLAEQTTPGEERRAVASHRHGRKAGSGIAPQYVLPTRGSCRARHRPLRLVP